MSLPPSRTVVRPARGEDLPVLQECLEADGEVPGLMILDGATVDLMMIDVRSHRQGLGRVLLSRAEEMLFAEYAELRLESFAGNGAANAFYAACGWSVAGLLDSGTPPKAEFVKHRGATTSA
ncbi:GNAT family N-acetyltransferase [Streptomyces sp. NPDC046324]|uniref:GNAT family N-acetyltransferase n=1 Tax=Streptomyces sp. NPDC046324 TaxID=3154915 RepID=UPI0033C654D9